MKHILTTIAALTIIIAVPLYYGSTYYYYSPLYQPITIATAVIHPTKGNTASGLVTFVQNKQGVLITANISGLTPGEHGFHIHEFGDCACDDAVCAGDHFNPTGQRHGNPADQKRHMGDLGNITADEHGNAIYSYTDQHITLNGPHSIIGRTVIVHAQKDDYISQPTGNAGARLGCGVIGIKQ
ncbi:MAG TPA: superoxide dismutase family protein [Candidatus Dependentiae bacterium]|nr:superoxide dismutase family protein [Candidatus Dependentiae bacterium]HRQ62888.1 superoxide dismutase family protein [Candidatus Dependentiae bacterium]